MTQLPTPVVVEPMSGLSQLVLTAFGSAQAVQQMLGAREARADQEAELLNRVEVGNMQQRMAEQAAALTQARIDTMKQRIGNEELATQYEETAELERLGLLKVISEADPEAATAFLNRYKFISPQNRNTVLEHHGRTIATLKMKGALAKIEEYVNAHGDTKGLNAWGLMDEALASGQPLPEVARISFMRQFLSQADALIMSRTISVANETQARGERNALEAEQDDSIKFLQNRLPWEDLLATHTGRMRLMSGQSAEVDPTLLAESLEQGFFKLADNPANVPVLRARWDQLSDDYKARMPLVPQVLDASEQRGQKAAVSGAVEQIRRRVAQAAEEPAALLKLQAIADHLPGDLPPEVRAATLADIDHEMAMARDKDHVQARLYNLGMDEATITAAGRIRQDFGEVYQAGQSLPALRKIARFDEPLAMSMISGTKNEPIGRAMIRARTDQEALDVAEVFDNVVVRDQVPFLIAQRPLLQQAGRAKVGGRPSPEMMVRWGDRYLIESARRLGDQEQTPIAPMGAANEGADKASSQVKQEYVIFKKTSVRADLLNIGSVAEGDDSVPSRSQAGRDAYDTLIDSFEDYQSWVGNRGLQRGQPMLLRAFDRGGKTYIPAVGAGGDIVSFMEWDPREHRARTIDQQNHGELLGPLRAAVTTQPNPLELIPHGDLQYFSGLPSRWVTEVDDSLFPDEPRLGYLSSLKDVFDPLYAQSRQFLPDFRPASRPTDDADAAAAWDAMKADYEAQFNLFAQQLGFYGIDRPKTQERRP